MSLTCFVDYNSNNYCWNAFFSLSLSLSTMADPEGVQGVRLNPLPLKISYEYRIIWSETKLFHLHGIF